MEQATEHIPKSLVYEMVGGKPIYYQGYKDYLDGKKQMDEIVGSSKLQALNDQYLDVPPELVIEIDTKADLREVRNPLGYYHEKTEDLIQFGVAKVVWIFTDTRKVLIAEQGNNAWRIYDWEDQVEIADGLAIDMKRIANRGK